jgi:hypothetical protein
MNNVQLRQAIELSRTGHKNEAGVILLDILANEPQNGIAWLWYADTALDLDTRIDIIKQGLSLAPDNDKLKNALDICLLTKSGHEQNASIVNSVEINDVRHSNDSDHQEQSPTLVSTQPKETPPYSFKTRGIYRTYFVEGAPKKSWLGQRNYPDKRSAKLAVEIHQNGGTEDDFIDAYRKLQKSSSSKQIQRVVLAKKEERVETKRQSQEIAKLRLLIKKHRKDVELRYSLAIKLLASTREFSSLEKSRSSTWNRVRQVSWKSNAYIYDETLEELNRALGIGLNDHLDAAKARFLVIVLTISQGISLPTGKNLRELQQKTYSADEFPGYPQLIPLSRQIVRETTKQLQYHPNSVEALTLQKAIYSFLGDQEGMGKVKQELIQLQSMKKAGLVPRKRTGTKVTVSKKASRNDGQKLELQAQQILQSMGLKATTTKASGDGGIDIEAYSDSPIYAGKYIIQCKDWNGSVGEPIVRELFGVVMSAGANKGIL